MSHFIRRLLDAPRNPSLQKYISVDASKPVQLSVKQEGPVDVFEMQVKLHQIDVMNGAAGSWHVCCPSMLLTLV